MVTTVIGLALTLTAAFVKLVTDWKDEDRKKRISNRILNLLAISGVGVAVTGAWGAEREATEKRQEIKKLNAALEIANAPKPKANLVGTFATLKDAEVPVTRLRAKVVDNVVAVDVMVYNKSEVIASNVWISVRLCDGCVFANEPTGWIKARGAYENDRQHVFGSLNPRMFTEAFQMHITPPPEVSQVPIGVIGDCDTCGPRDPEGAVLTIELDR
jgi:hypothetical protein